MTRDDQEWLDSKAKERGEAAYQAALAEGKSPELAHEARVEAEQEYRRGMLQMFPLIDRAVAIRAAQRTQPSDTKH